MKTKYLITCAFTLGFASSSAFALVINTGVGATPETTLSSAVLGSGGGVAIVAGSQVYQGNAAAGQSGTYTGFNLAPSSGSSATLVLPDGILLTSGSADLPLTNTVNQFNPVFPASGSNAMLSALSGTNTNDANVIGFDFTVDPSKTSVSAQFMFGTDEFPTQTVTDIFGFFVDGVNYAKFASGELISNTPGNPTNFISNPVGGGLYGIEYNGLTPVFKVKGLLDMNLATHHISFGVADTSDSIFDSGVFIGNLIAGMDKDGGIDPHQVPEPASMALIAAGLMGFAWSRRKKI